MGRSIRKLAAFTLIELLVVLAILSVLFSLLLPVIYKVREQSLTVACMGQMHQVALAVQNYATDYRFIVPVSSNYQNSGNGISWYTFYNGKKDKTFKMPRMYVDSASLKCPKLKSGAYCSLHPQHTTGNYFITASSPGWSAFWGVRLHAFNRASDFVLIADSISLASSSTTGFAGSDEWFTDRGATAGIWLAHNNRANAIFADMHVESCDTDRLLNTSNDNYNGSYANQTHGISVWITEQLQYFNPIPIIPVR